MLSIIIPALNEEKHLLALLESIKRQCFKDYEIIVADAGSSDKTVEIAKNHSCRIVSGGLPARGRNEGAKAARGDLFLFLDADTILPDNFLKKNLEDFKKRNLGVAIFFQNPQTDRRAFRFLFQLFYNWLALFSSKISSSLSGGVGILIKKSIHEKIGGFDEECKISEDVLYLKHACKIAKSGMIRKVRLIISVRRYEKDGWIKTYLKHLLGGIHVIYFGPVKSDIFKYKFGHDKNEKKYRKILS